MGSGTNARRGTARGRKKPGDLGKSQVRILDPNPADPVAMLPGRLGVDQYRRRASGREPTAVAAGGVERNVTPSRLRQSICAGDLRREVPDHLPSYQTGEL